MMKRIFAGLFTVLTIASLALVPSVSTHAEEEKKEETSQSALQISPSGARLNLSAGETLEGKAAHCPKGDDGCSVTVKNIGSAPIRFRTYASPYAVNGENNELSFAEEASNSHTQLYKWITVKNEAGEWVKEAEFAVPADGSKTIQYRIQVPEDLPGGSQYGVLWAQIINNEESGGIETVGQIGAVLTARSSEGVIETSDITDMDFTKFATSGPLKATAKIKNTGNVDYAVHYYYTAKTIFGKEIWKNGDDKFKAAYPDTTYTIEETWENPPFMGIFQVEWRVEAAGNVQKQTALVIIMPVIVMIVMFLLLTVVVVWIIIICRKRKERKARKLV